MDKALRLGRGLEALSQFDLLDHIMWISALIDDAVMISLLPNENVQTFVSDFWLKGCHAATSDHYPR
jgi:hypothetical protein